MIITPEQKIAIIKYASGQMICNPAKCEECPLARDLSEEEKRKCANSTDNLYFLDSLCEYISTKQDYFSSTALSEHAQACKLFIQHNPDLFPAEDTVEYLL